MIKNDVNACINVGLPTYLLIRESGYADTPLPPYLRDLNALGQQRAHVLALCMAFSIDFAQMLHTVNPLPLL